MLFACPVFLCNDFWNAPPPPLLLRAKLSMQCRSLQLLGCQSARSKHLKGQKNKRFPWVWKSFDFFALQMLRLALHCITQLVLHTFEEEKGGWEVWGPKIVMQDKACNTALVVTPKFTYVHQMNGCSLGPGGFLYFNIVHQRNRCSLGTSGFLYCLGIILSV